MFLPNSDGEEFIWGQMLTLLIFVAMATTAAGPPGYVPGPPSQPYSQHPLDTTGQVAPPGMKPRVTATLWEDEGSLCFQVEAKGVCVARREGERKKKKFLPQTNWTFC
jgi:hypothetical protein